MYQEDWTLHSKMAPNSFPLKLLTSQIYWKAFLTMGKKSEHFQTNKWGTILECGRALCGWDRRCWRRHWLAPRTYEWNEVIYWSCRLFIGMDQILVVLLSVCVAQKNAFIVLQPFETIVDFLPRKSVHPSEMFPKVHSVWCLYKKDSVASQTCPEEWDYIL